MSHGDARERHDRVERAYLRDIKMVLIWAARSWRRRLRALWLWVFDECVLMAAAATLTASRCNHAARQRQTFRGDPGGCATLQNKPSAPTHSASVASSGVCDKRKAHL